MAFIWMYFNETERLTETVFGTRGLNERYQKLTSSRRIHSNDILLTLVTFVSTLNCNSYSKLWTKRISKQNQIYFQTWSTKLAQFSLKLHSFWTFFFCLRFSILLSNLQSETTKKKTLVKQSFMQIGWFKPIFLWHGMTKDEKNLWWYKCSYSWFPRALNLCGVLSFVNSNLIEYTKIRFDTNQRGLMQFQNRRLSLKSFYLVKARSVIERRAHVE